MTGSISSCDTALFTGITSVIMSGVIYLIGASGASYAKSSLDCHGISSVTICSGWSSSVVLFAEIEMALVSSLTGDNTSGLKSYPASYYGFLNPLKTDSSLSMISTSLSSENDLFNKSNFFSSFALLLPEFHMVFSFSKSLS